MVGQMKGGVGGLIRDGDAGSDGGSTGGHSGARGYRRQLISGIGASGGELVLVDDAAEDVPTDHCSPDADSRVGEWWFEL